MAFNNRDANGRFLPRGATPSGGGSSRTVRSGGGKVRSSFTVISRPTPAWLILKAELHALKAKGGGLYVKAGFLSSNEESRAGDDGLNNATLAAVHEYGTDTIPARPFVGPAFDTNQDKYERVLRQWLSVVLAGKASLFQGMGLLGLEMVSDVRKFVTAGEQVPPPNAPYTLALKLAKSSGSPWGVRTLVDTGRMIGSLTHAVMIGAKPSGEGE